MIILLYTIIVFLGFVLGTALGSFINMLTWRVYKGESLLGRSYADDSHEPLKGTDLIPVLSYLLNKGRSKTSGERLPVVYPLVELLTGVLMAVVFLNYYNPLQTGVQLLWSLFVPASFITAMIFFAIYDATYWELEKKSVAVFLAIAIVVNLGSLYLVVESFNPVMNLAAAVAAYAVISFLNIIIPRSGLTMADALLTAATAAFIGLEGLAFTFIWICLSGSVAGLALIITKKQKLTAKIPYSPLLAVGALIAFFWQIN